MKYPPITLPEMLERSAGRYASEIAVIYFGSKISYARLQEHVGRFATGLQSLRVQKGDRVALFMPNCPQFVIAFFAVLRVGAVVTPTSPIYTAREIAHQWSDAGASVVVADRALLPVIEAALPQLPALRHIILTAPRDYYPSGLIKLSKSRATAARGEPRNRASDRPRSKLSHNWQDLLENAAAPTPVALAPSDLACLQYTGGTTGTSKGAMLTHSNLVINACQTNAWLTVGTDGHETMLAVLPFFHIYALSCTILGSILSGGTMVILPR